MFYTIHTKIKPFICKEICIYVTSIYVDPVWEWRFAPFIYFYCLPHKYEKCDSVEGALS